MMKRLLVVASLILVLFSASRAQCPQFYDYLGNLTSTPLFKSCNGAVYNLNLQSGSNFNTYTVSWGDGGPNTTASSYTTSSAITHTYASTVGTYTMTITIPGLSCTLTAKVIVEQAAIATVSLANIGANQCAPKTFTFNNITVNPSPSTTYTWTWGDGSPDQIFTAATNPSVITHTFQKGTVSNCATNVILHANNECNFVPSFDSKGPLQIFDVDQTAITPDAVTKCWPSATFQFKNTTLQNCLPQGNNGQRYEEWDIGNHWGAGHDSIITWKPWPPAGIYNVTYPAIGSYTVLLIDSNACGIKSAVQTVNIVAPPTASVTGPTGSVCANTSVTFTNSSTTGASYAYKWNFGTGGGFTNLGAGNKSIIYTTPGTYTVKLVVFVNGGSTSCADTASTVVHVIAAPIANFSYSPATGCNSIAAVSFTDGSTGATAWNWTFGNSNTFVGQNPPSQQYVGPGIYTVSLVVTGSTTCTHTKTATITVYSTPVPNFPTLINCVGAVSNFSSTSTVTGIVPIATYTWSFGDGSATSTSTLQNPSHTYTAAGTYSVQLITATPFCKDSVVKNISINVKPTANFVFTPTVNCPPFAVTFTNSTLNGVNYFWRFASSPTATSSLSNPSFTFDNGTQTIQNYTVTLVSTTGAACADSIKEVVSVLPKPVASFTVDKQAGCPPLIVTFTNTSIGASFYTWTFGDGSSIYHKVDTSHAYTNTSITFINRTAELIVGNSFGCTDTTSQNIQIYPNTITFSMTPPSGCSPLQVNFASVLGAASYTWDYGDGSVPGHASSNITHVYVNNTNATQTYTVTSKVLNTFGCIDSIYGYPVVYPLPVANFSVSPNSGCSPLAVNLTNLSIGNVSNFWHLDTNKTSIFINPTATYTNEPGNNTHTVTTKLAVTSIDGCKDSTTRFVILFEHPKAIFTMDSAVCSPKTVQVTNNSENADPNKYSWNFGDGNTSTLDSPLHPYANSTSFNQVYNVRLAVTSPDQCVDTLVLPIVVHPVPIFFISSGPDTACSPLITTFNEISGAKKYAWTFSNDQTDEGAPLTKVFANSSQITKTITANLEATDLYGCKATTSTQVIIYPLPTAAFVATPDSVYVPNQKTICNNISSNDAVAFFWSFDDGVVSTLKSPNHTYQKKGKYDIGLRVVNNFGCVDSVSHAVVALDETFIVMPNAFTPNSNGPANPAYNDQSLDNDVFHPVVKGTSKYEFSIFSRWGELLFDTHSEEEGWNGYYKGKICTQDVYIWKVTASFPDGKTYNKTGDLLLLR